MGNQYHCAMREDVAAFGKEFQLPLWIEHRGRFVENQNRRILDQGARQRDPLLLPSRKAHSTIADQRVVAFG